MADHVSHVQYAKMSAGVRMPRAPAQSRGAMTMKMTPAMRVRDRKPRLEEHDSLPGRVAEKRYSVTMPAKEATTTTNVIARYAIAQQF